MFAFHRVVGTVSKSVSRNPYCRNTFATVRKSKPFYRRIFTPVTVGFFVIGGVAYYAYKNPFDKESYIESLNAPTAYELETLTPKQVAAHTMILTRTGSRLMGKLMSIKIPENWREPFFSRISKWVGIDTTEFVGTFKDYETPNAFFTRKLKSSSRPIVPCKDIIISPVDGTFSIMDEHSSSLDSAQIHQVKGVRYSLNDFVGHNVHLQDNTNNLYSAVIYLAPTNYHRIHSASEFVISERIHSPGRLLPVMHYYANRVKGLFTLNERIVLTGAWNRGFFGLGLVGAYNVGSIRLTNEVITTNQPHELCYSRFHRRREFHPEWLAKQGEELGQFELGSTVVILFESPRFTWLVKPGEKVKMGQPLGYVEWTPEVKEIVEERYPRLVEEGKRLIAMEMMPSEEEVSVEEPTEERKETSEVVIVEVEEKPVVEERLALMDVEKVEKPVELIVPERQEEVKEAVSVVVEPIEKQSEAIPQEVVKTQEMEVVPVLKEEKEEEEEEWWWFTSEKKPRKWW